MLLTFSANEEKLLNKSKVRTTRANENYYHEKWRNQIDRLDMWYGNPRHMHLQNKRIYKMGIANWDEFDLFNISKGFLFVDYRGTFNTYHFNETTNKQYLLDIAIEDGFISVEEYLQKLGLINKMTEQEVKDKTWASLKWHWMEGPYTYEISKNIRRQEHG